MRDGFIIVLLMLLLSEAGAQELDRKVHFFNPKYFKSSVRHELNFSAGIHFAKSPMRATFYVVENGVAYPEPVYNRTFGITTLGYEPKLRLVQFGTKSSLSLDIPMCASFSLVDVLTGSGERYSSEPITESEFESGIFSKTRSNILGGLHVEAGALLSWNSFQGATLENTSLAGFSISGGVNHIISPLVMNLAQEYERDTYEDFLRWTTAVGRVGVHLRGVVFYYMFGVNPTVVSFTTSNGLEDRSRVNTYNRFSIAFRLGR